MSRSRQTATKMISGMALSSQTKRVTMGCLSGINGALWGAENEREEQLSRHVFSALYSFLYLLLRLPCSMHSLPWPVAYPFCIFFARGEKTKKSVLLYIVLVVCRARRKPLHSPHVVPKTAGLDTFSMLISMSSREKLEKAEHERYSADPPMVFTASASRHNTFIPSCHSQPGVCLTWPRSQQSAPSHCALPLTHNVAKKRDCSAIPLSLSLS